MNETLLSVLPPSPHKPWFHNAGTDIAISINYVFATDQSLVGRLFEAVEQRSSTQLCRDAARKINVYYGSVLVDPELCTTEGTMATETKTTIGLIFKNPVGWGHYWIEIKKPT